MLCPKLPQMNPYCQIVKQCLSFFVKILTLQVLSLVVYTSECVCSCPLKFMNIFYIVWSGEISLLSELAIYFLYVFIMVTKYCFKPCFKGEIWIDCIDYKLIVGTLLQLLLDRKKLHDFLFLVDNWKMFSFVKVFTTMLFKSSWSNSTEFKFYL